LVIADPNAKTAEVGKGGLDSKEKLLARLGHAAFWVRVKKAVPSERNAAVYALQRCPHARNMNYPPSIGVSYTVDGTTAWIGTFACQLKNFLEWQLKVLRIVTTCFI
jgi:hypothetical protein